MKRAVYPVEYDPLLRVFNNQLSFYQFLAQYNPEINVGLSALLPPTEFVIGSVHYPCRTIVDFFEKIAKHTGLPIDTGISTIRMGVILLFFTENLDESTLTLQSGDVNITLTPSVFKEVDAAFQVSVAEGHLWDPVGMPKKVTINDEQCNIVYEEDTQTFTIEWPKKRSQVVNLGLVSTIAPPPEPEPEPPVGPTEPGGDGEVTVADPQDVTVSSSSFLAIENKDEILKQAAALNNEDDKSGSKDALQTFAKEYGVTLSKAKTFQNMMKDFEAALA
ncbi:putative inhibitor of prohead protease [Escherichia phage vB_EcoM_SophiaRose]|uniref:Inhibitor of prohead protease n=1 Tax=Escherichia phage vB_EcoM_SophiaRose TaxID=2836106 RepID=A0AAE7V809_9CAUD|nr:putative inhibitor of prohead protease [Escherichia phage vB_EcoM_SophiaRose]